MWKNSIHFKFVENLNHKLLGLFLMAIFLISCVPKSPKKSRNNTKKENVENPSNKTPGTPTFSKQLNFFQNGANQSSSTFSLNVDYIDSFYLRGPEVDRFLRLNNNRKKAHCLVSYFPTSTNHKILITTATPDDFYNFETQTREDYLRLSPNSSSQNKNFCQTSGLITYLSSVYSGETISYDFLNLCSTCALSDLTSLPLGLYDPAGAKIDFVNISYLNMRIINNKTSIIPIGSSCQNSNECIQKGFDCCSSGQCVNDLQIKSDTNKTSSEYLQAAQEISTTPSSIYNYPNLFHICSLAPDVRPPITPGIDQARLAYLRFIEKQELHDCTIPLKGEMALCTITVPDVSEDSIDEYFTGADDRSFFSTYTGTKGIPQHSVDRIIHAGETLFSDNTILDPSIEIGLSNSFIGNDNLNDTLRVKMTHEKSSSAPDDDLKIRFKVDGSCEQVTSTLARCKKFYVQGQNTGDVDDHFPASNNFLLPFYADLNKTIQVKIDTITKIQGRHWTLLATSPGQIQITGVGLQVFDTQKLEITFFVDTLLNPVLSTRQDALLRIKSICGCADTKCLLKPKFKSGSLTEIEDYTCKYPEPDRPPPPLQQTVSMSAKTVPHRYFDENGVYQREVNSKTPPQEGLAFSYTGNNLLKPNNINNYIGFNEILGSFSNRPGSAKPALEVRVEQGRTYDIFANSGTFSTCFFCGTDYYTNVAKLFPNNFSSIGGGYTPDPSQTSKFKATFLRADDLLFGRACFVPASMLPWAHVTATDRQEQRLRRLQAQHFLFSNGYQRDWFGFDYGSLIGSFDGVSWFSIGNQRRIKATTSKLFLALNQSFGDLALEGSYSITISESSTTVGSGSLVTNDFESDGAQCQKFHQCNVDADCARQLGPDYICENIANSTSKWPSFDPNALEVPETEVIKKILFLSGSAGGPTNRCVYRGRGAPCVPDFDSVSASSSYSGTDKNGLHMCSANNYCQQFIDGVPRRVFNSKISRYGRSVKFQNASPTVLESNLDTFGMGIRSIGRPYLYNGADEIPGEAQSGLSNNNIFALCIPGRNPNDGLTTIRNSHGLLPGVDHQGDLVTGLGMTPTEAGPSLHYLSSCSVLGPDLNYIFKKTGSGSKVLGESSAEFPIVRQAKQFSIPTNSLNIFNDSALVNQALTKVFGTDQTKSPIYQKNRCLRAPGAPCYTEMDCSPNNLISSKLSSIKEDGSLNGILNKYEIKFWKEELVCSQEKKFGEDGFDLKNNKCCRELGKTLSIGTSYLTPTADFAVVDTLLAPAVELSLNSPTRYSRISTIQDKVNSSFFISAPADNRCGTDGTLCPTDSGNNAAWGLPGAATRSVASEKQWELIDDVAARTCCSGHWVRNFHKAKNGGGHVWGPRKHQNIDKRIFKCLNWAQCTDPINQCPQEFSCQHSNSPFDSGCLARTTLKLQSDEVFKAMNKLELLGIPQLKFTAENERAMDCIVNPDDQTRKANDLIDPIGITERQKLNIADSNPNTVKNEVMKWTVSAPDGDASRLASAEYAGNLFSMRDETNFDDSFVPRFSEDEFSCCKPPGEVLRAGENSSMCCTGVINPQTNACALPDFTNISLFYNRYISSAARELDQSLFNEETGFIKSPSTVERLACTQKICNSGVIARGVSLSNLKYRGHESDDALITRFIDGNDQANNFSGLASFYDAGLKWNNNLYCIPADVAQNPPPGLKLTDCSAF